MMQAVLLGSQQIISAAQPFKCPYSRQPGWSLCTHSRWQAVIHCCRW